SFLNIRVKDIDAVYAEWSARGAQFLTPPKQHQYETRCYIRDPDGHLIEVGQTTDPECDWSPAHWPSSTPPGEPARRRDLQENPLDRATFVVPVSAGQVPRAAAASTGWAEAGDPMVFNGVRLESKFVY